MPLKLRDDLYWCNCGGRAVFLDTAADRYFCLPHAANNAFLQLAAHTAQPQDDERLRMVIERGLLIEAAACARIQPPPLIDPPTHDLLEEPARGASLLCILQALVSELGAAWALRTRSFHEVIETARNCRPAKGTPSGTPSRSLEQIVSAASAVSLITRRHDRCLVRALAVHSMCRKSGYDPKLVLGVIPHPFAAHCWVQLGSTVLVGGYEQARLYTPILVLE